MTRIAPITAVIFTLTGCMAGSAEAPMAATVPMSARATLPASGGEVGALGGHLATTRGARNTVDERKLVRTGQLNVAVDAWDPFQADLSTWLEAHGGFVADVSLSRWEGRVGHASLRLRVPADQLDPLLSWTQEKVEVTHLAVQSEDVTAQWIDVAARLTALRQTEGRLLKLVDEGTATLADVLAAEAELGRIRGDIESFEQQQRALGDRVSLATLNLDVSVRNPYQSLVDQSLGEEMAEAWQASMGALGMFARGALIVAVACAPWLALAGLGLALSLWALKTMVRRTSRR